MSNLPRPVLDAIRAHLGDDHPYALNELLNAKDLVQALLDARVLVLMDDHMEVVRDRNEWEAADEEACGERDRARAEVARLRAALEWIASRYGDGPTRRHWTPRSRPQTGSSLALRRRERRELSTVITHARAGVVPDPDLRFDVEETAIEGDHTFLLGEVGSWRAAVFVGMAGREDGPGRVWGGRMSGNVLLPGCRERAWEPGEDYERAPSGLWVPGEQVPEPEPPRPVGVDLFCGAGGFSLGFHQAGWHVAAAAEGWATAACTYLLNLGGPDTRLHLILASSGAGAAMRSTPVDRPGKGDPRSVRGMALDRRDRMDDDDEDEPEQLDLLEALA